MVQLPSGWNIVFLGGGGAFGVVAFVTQMALAAKEETIRRVSGERAHWKEIAQEEREKTLSVLEQISSTVERIELGKVDSVTELHLRTLLDITNNYRHVDIPKMYEDCEEAGKYLESNRETLVDEAFYMSINTCPHLIPFLKKRKFKRDIDRYLDWAYQCLYRGGHRTLRLSDFVKTPALSRIEPYVIALDYIAEKKELGKLTNSQRIQFREAISRLSQVIQEKKLEA